MTLHEKQSFFHDRRRHRLIHSIFDDRTVSAQFERPKTCKKSSVRKFATSDNFSGWFFLRGSPLRHKSANLNVSRTVIVAQ